MPYPATFEPPSRRLPGKQAQARVQVKRLVPADGYGNMSDLALQAARWPFTEGARQERFYASSLTYCARCGHGKSRDHGCLYCGK